MQRWERRYRRKLDTLLEREIKKGRGMLGGGLRPINEENKFYYLIEFNGVIYLV